MSAVFDSLRDHAERGIDRSLAVAFANVLKIIGREAKHTERDGEERMNIEAGFQARLDQAVIQSSDGIKAAIAAETILAALGDRHLVDGFTEFGRANHRAAVVAQNDSLQSDRKQMTTLGAEREAGEGRAALPQRFQQWCKLSGARWSFLLTFVVEIVGEGSSQNFLAEIPGHLLCASGPKQDFSLSVHCPDSRWKGLEDNAMELRLCGVGHASSQTIDRSTWKTNEGV